MVIAYKIVPIDNKCWSVPLEERREDTKDMNNKKKWHRWWVLHQDTINAFYVRFEPFLWCRNHKRVEKIET